MHAHNHSVYVCTHSQAAAFTQHIKSLRAVAGLVRASCVSQTLRDTSSWTAVQPGLPTPIHTHWVSRVLVMLLSLSLFSSYSFAFCHSMTDSTLKCSTFSSSLFPPPSLHSLQNFHTGGTRGFLIACPWKHNLFPPSSASDSSCGLVPHRESGRQTDWVTFVYVSHKKHREEKKRKKWRISDIFAALQSLTVPV